MCVNPPRGRLWSHVGSRRGFPRSGRGPAPIADPRGLCVRLLLSFRTVDPERPEASANHRCGRGIPPATRGPLSAQSMARRRDEGSPAPEICGFPGGSAARGTARPALMKTRYSGLVAVGDRPADACRDSRVAKSECVATSPSTPVFTLARVSEPTRLHSCLCPIAATPALSSVLVGRRPLRAASGSVANR